MSETQKAPGSTSVEHDSPSSDYALLLFKSSEAYVYRVPPSTTVGHRAELWGVDKWLAEVHVKLVRFSNDEALIRLSDPSTAALYADAPVHLPLQTCVEPVVDSSRYFVIKVVDKESGHHAFIGLGFRERSEASDFNTALRDYQRYLEKKEEAAAMRKAFDDAYKKEGGSDVENTSAPKRNHPSAMDYSLRPDEKLTLKLGSVNSNRGGGSGGGGFLSSRAKLTKTFSLMFDPNNSGCSVAALRPLPAPSKRRDGGEEDDPMGLSPVHNNKEVAQEGDWGEFESAEKV